MQNGDIQSGWLSAQWSMETKDGYVRFKNLWTGNYLNIESNKGVVQLGSIKDGWLSAKWVLDNVNGYTRIRNCWNQTFMNTELKTGNVQCNAISEGALSSQWTIEKISDAKLTNTPSIKHVIQQWFNGKNPNYNPAVWGKYDSISSTACGVAAASMALSSLGIDKTPIEICDLNVAMGNRGDFMSCWSQLAPHYQVYITPNSTQDIKVPLANYKNNPYKYSPPIMYLSPAHFVVVTGETDTYYTIYDPGFPEDNRHLNKPVNYTQVGQFSK